MKFNYLIQWITVFKFSALTNESLRFPGSDREHPKPKATFFSVWNLYWLFLQSVTQAAAPVGKGDKKGGQGNVGAVNTSKTAQNPPAHSAHSLCSGVSMSPWTHFTAHVVPPRLFPFRLPYCVFPVMYFYFCFLKFSQIRYLNIKLKLNELKIYN